MSETQPRKKGLQLKAVFQGRCPACLEGKIMNGWAGMQKRCPHCAHNYFPEPGYYLGAMMLSFVILAVLIIPPMIILKVMNVDIQILMAFPFVELLVVGPFIFYYARILWLHMDYNLTDRLDGTNGPKP